MAHIFLLGYQSFALHGRRAVEFLNLISAVCQRWRNVALNTALLWTSISYGPKHTMPMVRPDRTLDRISAHLERSQNAFLHLLFVPASWDDCFDFDEIILQVIIPHIQRCRTIRMIYLIEDESAKAQLLPLPGPMFHLKELYITGLTYDAEAIGNVLVVDQTNRSSLSILHISHQGIFDTSNLCSHTISDLLVGGIARLNTPLEQSRLWTLSANSLTSLFSSLGFYKEDDQPVIHLPNLQLLGTTGNAILGAPLIICCPNLQQLVIGRPRRDQVATPIWDSPLPDRYFPWPRLHTLTTNADYDYPELSATLTALPTLTTIICVESGEGDLGRNVAEFLAYHSDVTPKLQTLIMEPPEFDVPSDDVGGAIRGIIVKLIKRRPLVNVICHRYRRDRHPVLVRDEMDYLQARYPNGFTVIDSPPTTLRHLYVVDPDVQEEEDVARGWGAEDSNDMEGWEKRQGEGEEEMEEEEEFDHWDDYQPDSDHDDSDQDQDSEEEDPESFAPHNWF